MLVAQVENDTLNNMVMLRTATGISKCLLFGVQFIFGKLHEHLSRPLDGGLELLSTTTRSSYSSTIEPVPGTGYGVDL